MFNMLATIVQNAGQLLGFRLSFVSLIMWTFYNLISYHYCIRNQVYLCAGVHRRIASETSIRETA